jgi:DNA primase
MRRVKAVARTKMMGTAAEMRSDSPQTAGTLAFTDRFWRCHRCNEGGDIFSLVRAVNRCDFPTALRFVAELAGIRLEDRWSADFRRKLAARKRQQERLEEGANKLAALEHALLRERRARIHELARTPCLFRGSLKKFLRQPQ